MEQKGCEAERDRDCQGRDEKYSSESGNVFLNSCSLDSLVVSLVDNEDRTVLHQPITKARLLTNGTCTCICTLVYMHVHVHVCTCT